MEGDPVYTCGSPSCGAVLIGPRTRCPMHPDASREFLHHVPAGVLPALDWAELERERNQQAAEDAADALDMDERYIHRADGRL